MSSGLGAAADEAPAGPTALPRAGDLLSSRFRLRRIVGRGAMGLVYEADDEVLRVRPEHGERGGQRRAGEGEQCEWTLHASAP